jgi:hypothetical protein
MLDIHIKRKAPAPKRCTASFKGATQAVHDTISSAQTSKACNLFSALTPFMHAHHAHVELLIVRQVLQAIDKRLDVKQEPAIRWLYGLLCLF